MDSDDVLRLYFEAFAGKGDVLTDDWLLEHFEEEQDDLEEIFSSETCSDNPACGDESESIYERHSADHTFYFAVTSTGGVHGPFLDCDEAIRALGYDPEFFSIDFGPIDPNADLPDAVCPFCGKRGGSLTCEHHLATLNGTFVCGGVLRDSPRLETWADWIGKAFTDGRSRGVMPKGVATSYALGELARSAKAIKRGKPFRVDPSECGEVVQELLREGDAWEEERSVLRSEEGPESVVDFHAEDPESQLNQCEERLRQWLQLPGPEAA